MFNLEGTRCHINGVKHVVLMDDGRTCLVERTTGNKAGSVCRRWVSRQTVDPHFSEKDIERKHYFWLGADAEQSSTLKAELKEMG